MKKRTAGFGEISQFVNRKAKMPTALIQYPSGRFGIVGSIPMDLTEERPYHLGGTMRASKVWDTKEEAHKALTDLGFKTTDGINYTKNPNQPTEDNMNQQVWNYLNDEQRTSLLVKCGWINRTGMLTPTGRRIYRSAWTNLSEAARNVIVRHFNA